MEFFRPFLFLFVVLYCTYLSQRVSFHRDFILPSPTILPVLWFTDKVSVNKSSDSKTFVNPFVYFCTLVGLVDKELRIKNYPII